MQSCVRGWWWALSWSFVLVACGGAPPPASAVAPTTSLRALTETEASAARSAIAATHGAAAEMLHAEAAGAPSRVLAIYAHTDVPTVPSAADRVCGASAEAAASILRDPACRYLAIGRLAPDSATLDARLELGAWCPDDHGTFELYAADFDDDGREEVSLMVGELASYVFDVTTFGVQFAGPGIDYQLLHPRGTGLVRPASEPDPSDAAFVELTNYDFEDDLDPSYQRCHCHPEECGLLGTRRPCVAHVPEGGGLELIPYDAAADCWRLPPATRRPE